PGVQLDEEPVRARRERTRHSRAVDRARMDGWSGAPIRGRLLPPRDERDDDLVNEAALRSASAQLVRTGEQLFQRRLLPPLEQVDERLDGQRVLEVDGQLVVAVGDADPARDPSRAPPGLDGPELRDGVPLAQARQLVLVRGPAGPGEDEPPHRDAREERRALQWAPAPPAPGQALSLQRAQEAIEPEAVERVVVRRRQARDHPAP